MKSYFNQCLSTTVSENSKLTFFIKLVKSRINVQMLLSISRSLSLFCQETFLVGIGSNSEDYHAVFMLEGQAGDLIQ